MLHNNPYNYNIIQINTLFQRLWRAIEDNKLDLAEKCIRLKADVNYAMKKENVSNIYKTTESIK